MSKGLGDLDDAIAECALIYVECRKKYGAVVNSPAHFMALYKRAVTTWFHDWSTYDYHLREAETNFKPQTSVGSDGIFALKLREASAELKQVLKVLSSAPREVLDVVVPHRAQPKEIFRRIAEYSGINSIEATRLTEELQELLG